MARFKSTPNGAVPFTPEEEAEADRLELEAQKPVVPQSITPRQARLVLSNQPSPDDISANLLAYVEARMAELPEPDKTNAQITWEYATEILRNDPLIAQMAAVIPLTDEEVDALFIQAGDL